MRLAWPDLEGVGVWRWPKSVGGVRVRIVEDEGAAGGEGGEGGGRGGGAVDAAAVGARWRQMCAINPRLYDGGLLSVVRMDAGREIVCRRETYQRLAVQPQVETGVEQLSVTGIVIARSEKGAEFVLLGRRGRRTRIYGGMWELAPSGGVEPPPPGHDSLGEAELAAQLQREMDEEVGGGARIKGFEAVAFCHDLVARSYDVVFRCTAPGALVGVAGLEIVPDRWEYEAVRWVPVSRIGQFDRENTPEIIPPTRGLFRAMGWA